MGYCLYSSMFTTLYVYVYVCIHYMHVYDIIILQGISLRISSLTISNMRLSYWKDLCIANIERIILSICRTTMSNNNYVEQEGTIRVRRTVIQQVIRITRRDNEQGEVIGLDRLIIKTRTILDPR